jgi:hypothetical protein
MRRRLQRVATALGLVIVLISSAVLGVFLGRHAEREERDREPERLMKALEDRVARERSALEKQVASAEQARRLAEAELKVVEEAMVAATRKTAELEERERELRDPKLRVSDRGVGPYPCEAANCTPVRIYFGTDRASEANPDRIGFGPERGGRLQLGRAIVTVPRAVARKRGEIARPSWFDLKVLRTPPEGDPNRHFTIPKGGIVVFSDVDEFIFAVQQQVKEQSAFKDHAFVFVHGFWTTFDDALYRTAQIAYDLGDGTTPFGTAFLYSWPSGGALEDYKYDFDSARFAVEHLASISSHRNPARRTCM